MDKGFEDLDPMSKATELSQKRTRFAKMGKLRKLMSAPQSGSERGPVVGRQYPDLPMTQTQGVCSVEKTPRPIKQNMFYLFVF